MAKIAVVAPGRARRAPAPAGHAPRASWPCGGRSGAWPAWRRWSWASCWPGDSEYPGTPPWRVEFPDGNGSNLGSQFTATWTRVKENLMLADLFGPDLLIVAIVLVVLLFGGAAIPKLARNLGSAKNQFEKGLEEGKADGAAAANGTSAARPTPRRPRPRRSPRAPERPRRGPAAAAVRHVRPRARGSMPSDVLVRRRPPVERRDLDFHLPPGRPHRRLRRDHRRRRLLPLLRQRLGLRHRGRPGPRRHRQRAAGPGRPRRHPDVEPGPAQHRRLLARPHRPRLRRAGLGGGGGGAGLGRPRGHRPPRPAGPLRPLHLHGRLQHHHQPPPVRLHRPDLAHRVPLPRPDLPRHPGPLGRRRRLLAAPREGRDRRPHRHLAGRDSRVLCCGDLFIWASPNAGNPQKVQRYPREWAAALRRMLELDAEFLLPGHGFPVVGADRVRQALTDTADLLDSLVDQTLAVMNAGGRLDDAIHTVRAAGRARGPALPATGLRRARVHRPHGVAPVRRVVGRQPRHAEAGRPSAPWRPSWPRWPAGRAPWPTAPSSCWRRRRARPSPSPRRPRGRCASPATWPSTPGWPTPATRASSGRASRSSPPGPPGPPRPWRGACSPGPPTSRRSRRTRTEAAAHATVLPIPVFLPGSIVSAPWTRR